MAGLTIFRGWRNRFAVLLAVLLSVSSPMFAQMYRGGINGTVIDSSGAAVPGAKVTAVEVSTSTVLVTVSSAAGEFSFNDLPQGTYNVKAEAQGFEIKQVNGVQVLAGKEYTLPIKLSVAQTATTVEVAANALALDTTSEVQTTTIEGRSLQDVPLNGRDFTQLMGSSVAFAGYNNSGSVNGTRNNQLNYTIDGTDNNDLYLNVNAVNQGSISGIAGVVYPVEALDEYSLQTTGNSEAGRSPGGNLNISTKSGTNEFHGDVYYYNRNEALAVMSPFATPGAPEQPLRNQNYGGSLGGPIVRDKTFFFLTYEEQKFLIGLSNTTTEPSPAYQSLALAELSKYSTTPSQVSQNILTQLWEPSFIAGLPAAPGNYSSNAPESGYSHNLVVHLDQNFSEKNHLSAIWYWGQGYADAPAGSLLPEYFQEVPSHNENFNVTWNYILRPNLTNEVTAGANFFTQGFADAVHSQQLLPLVGLNTGAVITGAPLIQINGFDSIGVTPTSGRNDIMGQISDILTWTVGKHQIRAGVDYRRAYIDLYYNFGGRGTFGFGTGGVLGPWSADTTVTDPNVLNLADFMAGYANHPSMILGVQERFIYTHTGSAYVQDSWQATPKMNINLGLRYDYQQPFYTNPPNSSIFDPNNGGLLVAGAGGNAPGYIYNSNKLDLSPRFGLAYQLTNKMVLRANYGIYFDQPAGQAFYGNLGVANGGANGVNNNPIGSEPNYSIVLPSPNPLAPVWTYDQPTPIFTPALGTPTGSNVASVYSVDRNFKTPYAEMFGLNIEQSLGSAWQLTVGYVGSVSRHNLVLQDVNQSALVPGIQLDQVTSPTQANGTTYGPVTVNGNTFSAQQASRPYFSKFPNIGIVNQMNSASSGNFNALQVTLQSSMWHGLTSQFAYAWSHNIDNASSFYTAPQNSFNLNGDRGNASQDIRNHFAAYLNYVIPGYSRGPQFLTHGWEVNGIFKFQGGEPINVLSGADNSGTTEFQDRATITGQPIYSNHAVQQHSFAQYLNQGSFAVPGLGTYGNMSRNEIYGPGFEDVDLSLIKNVPVYKERVRAQFRVEMFNVFNRVNLAQPLANMGYGGLFGASVTTIGTSYGAPGIGSGEPYNTQLAMKILF